MIDIVVYKLVGIYWNMMSVDNANVPDASIIRQIHLHSVPKLPIKADSTDRRLPFMVLPSLRFLSPDSDFMIRRTVVRYCYDYYLYFHDNKHWQLFKILNPKMSKRLEKAEYVYWEPIERKLLDV